MTTPTPLPVDIIIPAWNEAAVIGRGLDRLKGPGLPDEWRLIVACNGCTDATAQIAAAHGAKVLETDIASKPAAIRMAEQHCRDVARIYLDADVEVSGDTVRALAEALRNGALAARPSVVYWTDGPSRVIRRYYRARAALPSVMSHLMGAGIYGISPAGRARFGEYPDLVGEDNWIDAHFGPDEYVILDEDRCPPAIVHTPRTLTDLLRTTARARRGTHALVSTGMAPSTASETLHDLRTHARSSPGAALDALVYATVMGSARLTARWQGGRSATHWSRDASSRVAP